MDSELGEGDALLIIDVQRDFCRGGALEVPGGDEVVPVLNRWIEAAGERGVPVFASRDWHPPDHASFRGEGGPWKATRVEASAVSDPYLIWAYDQRTLTLSHDQAEPVSFHIELDLSGAGLWVTYQHREVPPGESVQLAFEDAVQARWLRVSASKACSATAWLRYE